MLLWAPAAAYWRGREGGTAGAVLDAALRALSAQGYRWPLPAPSGAQVAALAKAGSALNAAVRERYVRGVEAGPIAAAAADVAAAARKLGGDHVPPASAAALCSGNCDRLVHLRMDPRLHDAMQAAARTNGMALGAWVRDSVAAALGEHQARRPAVETRDGRVAAGRIAGLLVQAADVAADAAERAAVAAADAAVAEAAQRLSGWGSRR